MNNLKAKLRLTIGTKLVGLIALLLIGSVSSLIYLSTKMFVEDNTALIQQMNSDTAASLATQMREFFTGLTEKMRVMGAVLNTNGDQNVINEFFAKDKEFLAVYLHTHGDDGSDTVTGKAVSPEISAQDKEIGEKILQAINDQKDFSLAPVTAGEVTLSAIKLPDETSGIAVAVPFMASTTQEGKFTKTLVSVIRVSRVMKSFAESDIVTSFMVDRKGRLLAHPDATKVAAGENFSNIGVVKQLLEGKFNNGQTRYIDPHANDAHLGAFKTVGFAGLGVVAEVAEAKAFEAAKKVEYRSILVGLIVLSLAFFGGFIYSGTITNPLKRLVDATYKIASGDFNVSLNPKGQDEVAHLMVAVNDMAKGLEERDKVKETFNKFHNKEIAEKLLSGEVKLGGERKEAVVFFSDVRGFTGMSESMEPEQVVEMLNEYMTKMVAVITQNQGVVDKYVGDAIMALWGIPLSKGDDVYDAVKACLEMRTELSKLNELRLSRGQGPLKIGMGLNMGQVIAGNIGSDTKMEYTVIGDTVNTASRIESMTKEYGSDFLCSEVIYEKVKDRFIFEKCKAAKVKGKTDALNVYRVKGYYNAEGHPVIVETPYSTYTSEKSDKVQHDDHAPAAEEAAHEAAPAAVAAAPVHAPAPIPVVAHVEAPVAPVLPKVAVAPIAESSAPLPPPGWGAPIVPVAHEVAHVAPVVPVIPVAHVAPPAPVAVHVAAPAPAVNDEFMTRMLSTSLIAADDLRAGLEITIEPSSAHIVPPPMAAAPAPANECYFRVENEVFGPFTRDEMRQGLTSGELSPNMTVARSQNGPWIPLAKHPDFADVIAGLRLPKAA